MALPWPHGIPTLPRTLPAARPAARATPLTRSRSSWTTRAMDLALAPGAALAAMLIGLLLLFVAPMVGLPFVALIVLPVVIYHLRAEQRVHLRARR